MQSSDHTSNLPALRFRCSPVAPGEQFTFRAACVTGRNRVVCPTLIGKTAANPHVTLVVDRDSDLVTAIAYVLEDLRRHLSHPCILCQILSFRPPSKNMRQIRLRLCFLLLDRKLKTRHNPNEPPNSEGLRRIAPAKATASCCSVMGGSVSVAQRMDAHRIGVRRMMVVRDRPGHVQHRYLRRERDPVITSGDVMLVQLRDAVNANCPLRTGPTKRDRCSTTFEGWPPK